MLMLNKKKLSRILFAITYLIFAYLIIKLFFADVMYAQSRNAIGKGDIETATHNIDSAILYNPNEPRYFLERAKILTIIGSTKDLNLNPEIKIGALESLEKAEQLNSKNIVVLRNSMSIYYFLGFENINSNLQLSFVDEEYKKVASDKFEQLKATYPNDLGIFVLVAPLEKNLDLKNEFNSTIKKIEKLRPDLLDWYIPIKSLVD